MGMGRGVSADFPVKLGEPTVARVESDPGPWPSDRAAARSQESVRVVVFPFLPIAAIQRP